MICSFTIRLLHTRPTTASSRSRDLIGQWGTPYGGTWYAKLGGRKRVDDSLSQTVDVPAGSSGSLTYYYSIDSKKLDCDIDTAGLTNSGGNVLAMMPHPERAADEKHGGTDGKAMFASIASALAAA